MAEAPAGGGGGKKHGWSSGEVSLDSPDSPEKRRVKGKLQQLQQLELGEKARTEAMELEARIQSVENRLHRVEGDNAATTAKIDKVGKELDAAVARLEAGNKLIASLVKDWTNDKEDDGVEDDEDNGMKNGEDDGNGH